MIRSEPHVLDLDVVTASAREAERVPILDDANARARHEAHEVALLEDRTDREPIGMARARGPRPLTVQHAIDELTSRREHTGEHRRGASPQEARGRARQIRAEHRGRRRRHRHPTGRRVTARECLEHLDVLGRLELRAAEEMRQQAVLKAVLAQDADHGGLELLRRIVRRAPRREIVDLRASSGEHYLIPSACSTLLIVAISVGDK